ncbi:hypothetical protein SASPL_149014 [Salvia splendens]|uniref:DNA polymerase theta n=1 Tax=Salvia splendens TaxID=180675 RepID=A0A8X8WC13_SALSN|nr:hypothetical protein SASPL_149014 [Salvia splendens]
MASDSTRARIDQFFSSKKKRKFVPPLSKSERPEKEAKTQSECSPSAKGSLATYLETSPAKCADYVPVEKAMRIPAKRNLTLETALLLSSDEIGGALQTQPQSSEAFGVAQRIRNASLSGTDYDAVEGVGKKSPATEFLSLYFSDVRSSVNIPSDTKETADKRHCSAARGGNLWYKNDDNPSKTQNESFFSPKGGQLKRVEEPVYIGFNHSEKDIVQTSLRKCNNTTALYTAECETPASFPSKLGAGETPRSTRGSSSFSPGDAFWNEAILVADGIAYPNAGLSSHVTENNEALKVDSGARNSNNVKDRGFVHQLNSTRDGVAHSVSDFRACTAVGMHLDKDASPVPVKHFDFSSEAKNLEKEIPADTNKTKSDILITKETHVDCLQVEGVLHNRNLVYCASTSAGKSFVAEILMLRRVLETGKIALLVLPYVCICAEKGAGAEHLEVLLEPVGKHVLSFYGNQGGGSLPKDTSVAVCTIEKANSLINRLLEQGRLSELGTIVIDELHMVGDQSRGYLLELLLTKLRYAAGEGNVESSSGENSGSSSGKSDATRGLQIIGMSAALPNVAAVAEWLQAALYETEFRRVPLEEYIKIGRTIYNKKMEIVRTIPKVAELGGKYPDQIVELCNEVVQEGHSVLIFCSSRKGCESTAKHIAKYLKGFCVNPRGEQGEPFDVAFAIDSLRRSPAGLDPVLNETLPFGVAYHHAGLTVEERETVEMCYRKGLVRVLTATSTLAAGVNLPARRVIFRQPRIGRDFIDGTRYKQMSGRAGRTGWCYFMFSPIHLRNAIDLSVVAWILSPDEEKSSCPNLEKEAKRRLSSDALASTNRSGRWKDQTRRAAHNGCCRRVAQTRALSSVLWKLLHSEELIEPLITVEIRLVNILADMEISGIGVDMEGCLRASHVLGKKLKMLEKEAYRLAGKTFSLSMPADIANILYDHLKLPMPEGYEGKNHHRTDKHCLEMLRDEHLIVPVIKEHRTLTKLFNSTLGSICSLARLSMRAQKYTLHAQSVEHMVEFEMNEDDGKSCVSHYKINARDFFVPTQDDWVLLTADYCQIELRLMAHFSKDRSLIELLTKQLDCSPDEAAETIQNFKKSFPGVASWLQEAVTACHKKGYVKTLKGRKRFLSNIKFGNSKEKSKAQRQAVNSICQGSAADIIKIAMICLHDVIGEDSEALCPSFIDAEKCQLLKGRCRILLQVHDELVLEADHSVVKEAGLLLQSCMERAMSLHDGIQFLCLSRSKLGKHEDLWNLLILIVSF